jgi:hypothetical protein
MKVFGALVKTRQPNVMTRSSVLQAVRNAFRVNAFGLFVRSVEEKASTPANIKNTTKRILTMSATEVVRLKSRYGNKNCHHQTDDYLIEPVCVSGM